MSNLKNITSLLLLLSSLSSSSSKIMVHGFREICHSKTCLTLCCSPRESQIEGKCIEDNVTSLTFPQATTSFDNNNNKNIIIINNNITEKNNDQDDNDFDLYTNDSCAVEWMTTSIINNFKILKNGSIYVYYLNNEFVIYDSEHHCLFRRPGSSIYMAKICHPWIIKIYWQILCWILLIIIMLIILIVYSIVPELNNLHGTVFRSYIGTYIFAHISMIGQQLTTDSRTYPYLFTFFVFSLHYAAGCCALWLNVMSFNIWRTFRDLRSFENTNKDRDKKKYIFYAIYAWVTPGIYTMTTTLIMTNVSYFQEFSLNKNLVLWSCATLLTTVVICNTILFSITAIKIKHHIKDTEHLAKGVNKHHEAEKQRFNLHVKLFMITGIHTMMWVVWELWPTSFNTILMITVEIIQCILIFFIFIWKNNIKRSICKEFNKTLCRLQSNFHTTSNTSNTVSAC